MMKNFEGEIVKSESPFTTFEQISADHTVFIKRDSFAFRTLHELPPEIGLIYVARHPFDVLTSYHAKQKRKKNYYVSTDRWLAEFDAFERIAERDKFILRYEDLIDDPDRVQSKLALKFGLVTKELFSHAEKLRSSSQQRWDTDEKARDYLANLPEDVLERIKSFAHTFRYPLPDLSQWRKPPEPKPAPEPTPEVPALN